MKILFFLISALAPIWLLVIAIYYFVTAPRRERVQPKMRLFWRVALWLTGFACLFIVPGILQIGGLETAVLRRRLELPPIPIDSKLIYTLTSYLQVGVMLARSRHKRSAIIGWYFYAFFLISAMVGTMWFFN